VRVQTTVVNAFAGPRTATVRQRVVAPDGKIVAEFSASQPLAPGATATVEMSSPPIARPRLWHPDHPFLYTLDTTIVDGSRVADRYATVFGIRTLQWTADRGFFLNGEHLYLRVYAPGWGDLARDNGEAVHPWRAGQAIWAGFDHGSIMRDEYARSLHTSRSGLNRFAGASR
jgi:beta-galactosidase